MSAPINPNNPFVKNELYFAGKPGSFVYRESGLYYFYIVHYVVVALLGLPLALFVYFLILRKSNKNLMPYRKMFLIATTVDTALLMDYLMVQTRVKADDKFSILNFVNLGYQFNFGYVCTVLFMQNIFSPLCFAMLAVQCFYRYYTVKNNHPPSNSITLLCFALSVLVSLIFAYDVQQMFCAGSTEWNPHNEDFGPLWYPEVPIPPLLVAKVNDILVKYFISMTILIFIYVVAIAFAFLTMVELRKNFFAVHENKNLQAIHKQLTWFLLAQSLIPLLTTILPRIISSILSYLQLSTEREKDISSISSPWLAILNFLSTITFIHPYRSYLTQLMCCKKPGRGSGSNVSVIPQDSVIILH